MPRSPASPERFAIGALDALSANVAILGAEGEILAVNAAWKAFSRENGGGNDVGGNYLRVCDGTQGEDRGDALRIAAGIREVLRGEQGGGRIGCGKQLGGGAAGLPSTAPGMAHEPRATSSIPRCTAEKNGLATSSRIRPMLAVTPSARRSALAAALWR